MGVVDAVDVVYLNDGWLMKASIEVEADGEFISTGDFIPENWYPVALPSTVLSALVKNGVYPDPRIGLNTYLIPDASDEFNAEHDLARYSYLPGKENPWTTPYWHRTEFRLPAKAGNTRYWLDFKGINYRADVWLNGVQIANHEEMAGANNYLAVKIHQVDHPGKPDMQLDVFGKERRFFKEIMKDVTLVMAIGYDCMPTVCDRNMGLWQEVCMDSTGPVDVRNPFVRTSLPLPDTSPARLTISAELVNATQDHQKGVLKGKIEEEVMFGWDAKRMETEIRYLTEANLNLIYFEDIPNPPDEFLDICDRYGLMFGNCFYGCYWMTPGSDHPLDVDLLDRGTIDIIKRYRNHPSLVLYMAMNEGDTREDVYESWRKNVIELDGTRIFIPSGSFPDYRKDVPEWIKKDIPVGMNDYSPKSYGWQEPSVYYKWVREERNWMFMIESGSASLPPIESLNRFIPNLGKVPQGPHYPLDETWAHHGANHYYEDYDRAVRRIYGPPDSVADYCLKGHLVTADQHRAMFEAANHRMWDITSGFTEWKINACWPSVQWQIYDWYFKPMVSYYYIKSACEPLHIQLSPIDSQVTVVNNHLEPKWVILLPIFS